MTNTASTSMMAGNQHRPTLVILHHVFGGLCNFFGLLPLVHIGMGLAITTGVFPHMEKSNEQIPPFLGYLFLFVGLFFFVGIQAVGLINHIAARCLAKGRGFTFLYVVAIINCLCLPLGTALGVYSLIVYNTDDMKRQFLPKK